MDKQVKEIFKDYEYMLKKFRRKDYIENMKAFRTKWDGLISSTIEAGNFEAVSENFVQNVISIYTKWGRISKIRKMDLGLFMVYFVFPAILLSEKSGAEELCNTLLATWNEKMNSNIEYMKYDDIVAGFNDKMFGMF